MSLELYAAYVMATFVVLAIPGPTIMLVIGYALTQGKRSAGACVLGVGLGDVTAAFFSLLGLGAVLATSATAFLVIKWIGAGYLAYLGIKMWRSAPKSLTPETVAPIPLRKIFLNTYIVTALNPKGIVFFMAFLPQFIVHGAPVTPQLLLLGSTFVVLGIINAAAFALGASMIGTRLKSPQFLKWVNRAGGGFLVSAAAMTAAMQRS